MFPTFHSDAPLDMMEIGITQAMYVRLQRVAAENKCVLMLRKTNRGSVTPFANRTAVGKKLATKGKSSAAFFTKGNITFLAEMAKKLKADDWYKEQCTLIGVMGEPKRKKSMTSNNQFQPKYRYIPKLIPQSFVDALESKDSITKRALRVSGTLAYFTISLRITPCRTS